MSVNRSEEIRRFYEQNPGARPKECIIALAAQGIDVSPTLVSCVRAKLKERVPERDIASDVAVVREFVDSSGLDPEVALEILTRFAGVVEKVGGLDRFREVLEVVSASVEVGPGGGPDDDDEPVVHETPVVPEPTPTPTPDVSGFSYDDVNDDDDDD
jgi:hypothetical protein